MDSHLHLGGINVFSSKLTKKIGLKIKLATYHQNNQITCNLTAAGRFSIKNLSKNNALNPFSKFRLFAFIF